MKAVVLKGNENLIYQDFPTPQCNPDEILIKVKVCGICGSDVPRVFANAAHNYPLILGHEFSGLVASIGKNVSGFNIGEAVTVAPLVPCLNCEDCKNGNYSLCAHYSFIGSRRNGAMADYVAVPAKNVLKLPPNISMEQAATIEPSTVALHALRLAKFVAGKNVIILGCGIIGLYTLLWAKALKASKITVLGRSKKELIIAKNLGADDVFSTEGLSIDEVKNTLPLSEYVFECAGADMTMHLALALVAKKGTVCYIGTPKKSLTFTVPEWEQINRKEAIVTGSWMSYSYPFPGTEWTDTIEAMQSEKIPYSADLIAGTFPMKDAFNAFKGITSGSLKGRVLLKNS